MSRLGAVALLMGVLVLGVAVGRGDSASRATPVSALTVVQAKTPALPVPRYETKGTYPRVKARESDLRAVNAALRAAILSDQRSYAREARREQAGLPPRYRGLYRTGIERRYLSASGVVVSALLPVTEEVFPSQHGGDGWLGMTVLVPSGRSVTITDLFANPDRGIRVLASAWKARIRRTGARPCLRIYASDYTPTAANYRAFALAPNGLVVGSWEDGACLRLVATVPYAIVRPYFSLLGARVVAGVRQAHWAISPHRSGNTRRTTQLARRLTS